jgi:PAS domain S-box-containing protein
VALLIVIVSSFHRFTVLQDEVTAETRSALWHVSQLEKELLRFRGAVMAYHSGSRNTSHDDLERRFDILWSRIPVLLEGNKTELLRRIESLSGTLRAFLMDLEEIEPILDQMEPGDDRAYMAIENIIGQNASRLQQLALDVYHEPSWFVTFWRDRTKSVRIETAVAIAVFALCFGLFIFLITRAIQRAERLILATKSAERAQRLSERRFKDFAEAGSDWFWETDGDLRLVFVSDRFLELHGGTHDEVLGQRLDEVHSASLAVEPEQWQVYFDAVAESVDFRDLVHEDFGTQGRRLVIRSAGRAIFDEDGSFLGFRGTSSDITKEIEAREVAGKIRDQLRQSQKLQAIGQLTGGIAHDFNNLLAVVSGNAEVLARRYGREDEIISSILDAAGRGAELTQRLRAFSRQQPLDPVAIDLAELIAAMASVFRRTLGERMTIETRIEPDLEPVFADRGQLESALLNLAINARDAMPEGGQFVVSAMSSAMWQKKLPVQLNGRLEDYLILALADNGVGMAPDVIERAFEPFYTTKEIGEGTGLGLSIVYGFVTQSGGSIHIESSSDQNSNQGTKIYLFLPKAESEFEAVAAPCEGSHAPVGEGQKILVVEDDPDVRRLTAQLLEMLGYEVLIAESGEVALELLSNDQNVALIISDMVLSGGLSGLELAKAARSRFDGLRFIYMSGYPNEVLRQNGAELSDVELLAKPFRLAELGDKVRAALEA